MITSPDGIYLKFRNSSFSMDKVKDKLIIDVRIEVKDIYDLKDEKVARQNWIQHGIDGDN